MAGASGTDAPIPFSTTLNQFMNDLKQRDEHTKREAAKELAEFVRSVVREQTGDYAKRFIEELNKHVYNLVVEASNAEAKKGGIEAIAELIEVDTDDNSQRAIKYAHLLRGCLPNADADVMERAAKTIGKLARVGSQLQMPVDVIVDFEATRALEWLTDKMEQRRLGAALILRELSLNTPTLFTKYIGRFFEVIWTGGVRDKSEEIREVAMEAVRNCFSLLESREMKNRSQIYDKCFSEAMKGMEQSKDEQVLGSLVTFAAMLSNTGDYLTVKYPELAERVIKAFTKIKNAAIRRTIILLLPDLAAFRPEEFVKVHLNAAMTQLLQVMRKEKDSDSELRGICFVAVGKLAKIVRQSIVPWMNDIIGFVSEGLVKKRNRSFSHEALTCVSLLAEAQLQGLRELLEPILDQMYSNGLSKELTHSVEICVKFVPELHDAMTQKLLDLLSMIISGVPYRHPGAPARIKTVNSLAQLAQTPNFTEALKADQESVNIKAHALHTLGSFNFSGYFMHEFVKDNVLVYLENDQIEIRKQAALTISRILAQNSPNTPGDIAHMLIGRLLAVVVADREIAIRTAVLYALEPALDHHLAQVENLRTLSVTLNANSFEIRQFALRIIGRLAPLNPAYVLPTLRATLRKLLAKLEFSGDSRNKEESAILLGTLISSCEGIVKPYVHPIMKKLMPKLVETEHNQSLAGHVLKAIGELCKVGGKQVSVYLPQLLPQLIEMLEDQSSVAKREIAMETLGQLIEHTGMVIKPYLEYPKLLTMLLSTVKNATSRSLRRQVIKLIGILGALDPQIVKIEFSRMSNANSATLELRAAGDAASAGDMLPSGVGPSSEEYYPTIAVMTVMNILQHPSLSGLYKNVASTLMQIFQTLGVNRTAPFLAEFIPAVLRLIGSSDPTFRETLFQYLGSLVVIAKQHIKNFLPEIFEAVHKWWDTTLLMQILVLSEEVCLALPDEFKVYLSGVLPRMLSQLQTDHSVQGVYRRKVLHALETFGASLDNYVDLVAEAVVELFEGEDSPQDIRIAAVQTLGRLMSTLHFSAYASRFVHALAELLEIPALRSAALATLTLYAQQLGQDYVVFIPSVNTTLAKFAIVDARYQETADALLNSTPLPVLPAMERDEAKATAPTGETDKISVSAANLRKVWEASNLSTKDDWFEWIRRISVELLRQSSSPALRACTALAQVYPPLARQLFNAGFVSCWSELAPETQQEMMASLEGVLAVPTIPAEILQQLLNLAEFMDRDGKALPIDIHKLGDLAVRCRAFAKALRHKEMEYSNAPSETAIVTSLISINNQLQDPAAADGILLYARGHHSVQLQSSWYEILNRWTEALQEYETLQRNDPLNPELTLGRLRCQAALGDWEQVRGLANERWAATSDKSVRQGLAPLAAAAAWNLGLWSNLDVYITELDDRTRDGLFFRAILAVHNNSFEQAKVHIDGCRDLVDTELAALVGESYNRAYSLLVHVQQLAELEEVINYKQAGKERRLAIRSMWNDRLEGNAKNVEVWQQLLGVRSLVLSHEQNTDVWLRFAKLCRKNGQQRLCLRTIVRLLGFDPAGKKGLSVQKPWESYAYLKYLWHFGEREEALKLLQPFVTRIKDDTRLLARLYLSLGMWQMEMQPQLDDKIIPTICDSLSAAAEYDMAWYKAWHEWAMMNFEVVEFYEKQKTAAATQKISQYITPAVHGFFRAISLDNGNNLQDTLRLLTLWFKYGYQKHVEAALLQGMDMVPISTWLQVIPQIIARIHTANYTVRHLIHVLLSRVGREHPQAVVYPLAVAAKSASQSRRTAALSVIDTIKEHSAVLVEQAMLVSKELIRVAIVWNEMWYEAIEEASRHYFNDSNLDGMLNTLAPHHRTLEKGPETLSEQAFVQAFATDLREARDLCKKYLVTRQQADIGRAWDYYLHVFRAIQRQLPKQTSFELHHTSPKLASAENLELAVPGTYRAGHPVITIASFDKQLSVITSSKRPRKCTVHGSDGQEYKYLLKGHEDLRQDERVMQLFGLVNHLLVREAYTSTDHFSIQRFEAIPLSPNSGLLSWVPHCDTLHALIREHRKVNNVALDHEHRLMMNMAPTNFDNLTTIQKVEVFEYALARTSGADLATILWLKSPSAESWYEKRLTYTRSLAVMSMVGYILGLGDRHPSNLMIDRLNGKILHIDFGDCFEVAMHRERYAEKIPFRLTRMLIQAMEVSGIEGNFRVTCERVMRVLRDNKDSLMAVLEAFVHDPLMSWRLLTTSPPQIPGVPNADRGVDSPARPHDGNQDTNDANDLSVGLDQDLNSLNEKAVEVVNRVSSKLTGRDFPTAQPLDVPNQVDRLILAATSHDNLCQCYIGWCPFW